MILIFPFISFNLSVVISVLVAGDIPVLVLLETLMGFEDVAVLVFHDDILELVVYEVLLEVEYVPVQVLLEALPGYKGMILIKVSVIKLGLMPCSRK
jgi:hypothetical protein